jgi:hypothetical protein
MLNLKVGDYISFRDIHPPLTGWVDGFSGTYVHIQCGKSGTIGKTIERDSVVGILPSKERPLAYWKREICQKCKSSMWCNNRFMAELVDRDCPYVTEFVMLGAKKI